MIATLLLLTAVQQQPTRGIVLDAAAGNPVVAALITTGAHSARSDAEGRFTISAREGDSLIVQRLGYRRAAVMIEGTELVVRLRPAASLLQAQAVHHDRETGRMTSGRTVEQLVQQGIGTTGAAIAAMPFISSRSARGETSISLRGARAEQVLVTIDGMPLNDPATGRADVSDIPLLALGSVTVAPGSGAAAYGSGASGGVVALTTGDGSAVSMAATSLNGIQIEGALAGESKGLRLRSGVALASSRNDFAFLNDAGAEDTTEQRVNADERRAALFLSGLFGHAQVTALYSVRERGLGGAKNVRAYDHARELADRRMVRARVGNDRWQGSAGVRRLAVRYRDERQPELASHAAGITADAELQAAIRGIVARAGVAQEHVWGSTLAEGDRPSAFASVGSRVQVFGLNADIATRVDAVRDAGVHLSPSIALERAGRIRPFVRYAQGFRLPAFYDLYVPTPLGFVATGVDPERVIVDAEVGAHAHTRAATFSATVFERRTRDAVIWFPGNFSWSPKNVAREQVRGAEAMLLTTTMRATSRWWGGWYDTRLFTDGLHVPTPYVPKLAGGGTTTVTLGRLSTTASLTARGRRPFAIAIPSRALEMHGVFLLDLATSYRIDRPQGVALVTAGVLNVGNVASETVRRFPSPGRVWQVTLTVQP